MEVYSSETMRGLLIQNNDNLRLILVNVIWFVSSFLLSFNSIIQSEKVRCVTHPHTEKPYTAKDESDTNAPTRTTRELKREREKKRRTRINVIIQCAYQP